MYESADNWPADVNIENDRVITQKYNNIMNI